MAIEQTMDPTNGAGAQADSPQIATLAQSSKDWSVECPSAPQVFRWQEQPQLNVNFSINVDKVEDGVHEVVLKIEVSARSQSGVHFLVDLSYGGLFGLRNFPEEALGAFLLAEAPRLLFPFARQIVADATQQTGFPPLLLDPIDFGAAYMAQVEAAQAEQGENGSNGGAAPSEPSVDTSEG
jgi:preprotein translocase subunit SecB